MQYFISIVTKLYIKVIRVIRRLSTKMLICKICGKEVTKHFKRHEEGCGYKRCVPCGKQFRGLQEFAVHYYLKHRGKSFNKT